MKSKICRKLLEEIEIPNLNDFKWLIKLLVLNVKLKNHQKEYLVLNKVFGKYLYTRKFQPNYFNLKTDTSSKFVNKIILKLNFEKLKIISMKTNLLILNRESVDCCRNEIFN